LFDEYRPTSSLLGAPALIGFAAAPALILGAYAVWHNVKKPKRVTATVADVIVTDDDGTDADFTSAIALDPSDNDVI